MVDELSEALRLGPTTNKTAPQKLEADLNHSQEEIEKRYVAINNKEFTYFTTQFGAHSSLLGAQLRFIREPLVGVVFDNDAFAWTTGAVSHTDIEKAEMSKADDAGVKISAVAWVDARIHEGTQERQIDVFVNDCQTADSIVKLLQSSLKSTSRLNINLNFLLKVDLRQKGKTLLLYKGKLPSFRLPDPLTELPEDTEFSRKTKGFYSPTMLDGRIILLDPNSNMVTSGFSDNEVCARLGIQYSGREYRNMKRAVRVSEDEIVITGDVARSDVVKMAKAMRKAGEPTKTIVTFNNGQSEGIGNLVGDIKEKTETRE